jgi:hypothetical protein
MKPYGVEIVVLASATSGCYIDDAGGGEASVGSHALHVAQSHRGHAGVADLERTCDRDSLVLGHDRVSH